MKVSELSGAKLDFWVGKMEGKRVSLETIGGVEYCLELSGYRCRMGYSPSTDWARGGPIIEMRRVMVSPVGDTLWYASIEVEKMAGEYAIGETPLIAAMRRYVASKYGDEVTDGNV
jgi:hypothetical protein